MYSVFHIALRYDAIEEDTTSGCVGIERLKSVVTGVTYIPKLAKKHT
jgi:hypothetical protein